jgi:hypothetical protein
MFQTCAGLRTNRSTGYATLHEDVITCLADGEPVVKVELAGLGPVQGDRHEATERVRVVVVDFVCDRPALSVVSAKERDIAQSYFGSLQLCRPTGILHVNLYQEPLLFDGEHLGRSHFSAR